jgi:hypothetical protein
VQEFGEDQRYAQSNAQVVQVVNMREPFRFFQIEALSGSWSGHNFFLLKYIEMFGTLYEVD